MRRFAVVILGALGVVAMLQATPIQFSQISVRSAGLLAGQSEAFAKRSFNSGTCSTQTSSCLTEINGTTTNGSVNVTTATTVGIRVGQAITGTGIAANTTVASITDGTHFKLSQNATATAASHAMKIAGQAIFESGIYTGTANSPTFTASATPTIVGGDPVAPLTNVNGIPVFWAFQNYLGAALPADLNGNKNAHMYLSITSTTVAHGGTDGSNGNPLIQPFDSITLGHIYITPDTPYAGVDPLLTGKYVLLSVDFDGSMAATGSHTVGFGNDTADGDTVVYRSDFLDFTGNIENSSTYSASDGSPCLTRRQGTANGTGGCYGNTAVVTGDFIRNFVSAGTWNFSADPKPFIFGTVPEPMSMALVGSALIGLGILRRRSASKRR